MDYDPSFERKFCKDLKITYDFFYQNDFQSSNVDEKIQSFEIDDVRLLY